MGQQNTHHEAPQDTRKDTIPTPDFYEVLQEVRLPLRLVAAAIGGVSEAGSDDPVAFALEVNEGFGNDVWSVIEDSIHGLRKLEKAHVASCARMAETGNIAGARRTIAHYFGVDFAREPTEVEIQSLLDSGLAAWTGQREGKGGTAPLVGSIDRLLATLRARFESGSAVAQIEKARTLLDQAVATEEAVRNRAKRTALDVIGDGAADAFEQGDTEDEYLLAVSPGGEPDSTIPRYRDQLAEQGRWPWGELSPEINANPRPAKDPATERDRRIAHFDRLVADLPDERKLALLSRLEGVVSISGRIRRSPEQDLEGDEELREQLRNDPGGALRSLLPAFFAADDERRRHLIALADEALAEGRGGDAVA